MVRPTLSDRAICAMVMAPRSRMVSAAARFSGVSFTGRPPSRPAALATSRPAWEHSRMSSRSLFRAVGYAARDLELLANWADRDFALGIIAAV